MLIHQIKRPHVFYNRPVFNNIDRHPQDDITFFLNYCCQNNADYGQQAKQERAIVIVHSKCLLGHKHWKWMTTILVVILSLQTKCLMLKDDFHGII